MASLTQEDFVQKLRDLGYLPSSEQQAPASDSQPQSEEENAALQPPAQSPTPSNQGAAEEQANARSRVQPEFPPATPVPQADQGKATDDLLSAEEDKLKNQPPAPLSPANIPPPPGPVTPANPMEAPGLNDEALKQAQGQAENRRLFTGIGDAFATAAAAPSGKAPDEAFFKEQMKNADQPVSDIETRRKAVHETLLNAASQAELGLKNMTLQEKQQLSQPGTIPSEALKKVIAHGIDPKGEWLTNTPEWKQISGNDALQFLAPAEAFAKADAAKAQKEAAHAFTQGQAEQKQSLAHQKEYLGYMSPESKGFNNEVRKQIDLSVSADRAQAVLNQYKDPKTGKYMIPPERMGDLNLSVVNLLTNGKGSVHALESITPHNIALTGAGITEWLKSDPSGADQTKWMQDYQGLLDRENKISKQYTKDYFSNQHKNAQQSDMYDTKPEYYDNIYQNKLKQYNLGEPEEKYNTPAPGGQSNKPGSNPNVLTQKLAPNEEARLTKDGKTAIFDKGTKQFVRFQ